mmetsp:Transcript_16973/g.39174  ORF Transcript_16973/g.39174 Transcript_16973/m.39174 type:complete len:428 (-) Transcript_16973:115-1398(-)
MRRLLLLITFTWRFSSLDGSVVFGTYGADEHSPVLPLVTGCGRAGTHTAGELLNSLGIPAVHEGARDGSISVSWFYGANESFRALGKGSGSMREKVARRLPSGGEVKLKNVDKRSPRLVRAASRGACEAAPSLTPIPHSTNNLSTPHSAPPITTGCAWVPPVGKYLQNPFKVSTGVRFWPVVHIVRHPLTHIEATARCICAKGSRFDSERSMAWDELSWAFAAEYLALPGGLSPLERSARYWLGWNELVEWQSAKAAGAQAPPNRKGGSKGGDRKLLPRSSAAAAAAGYTRLRIEDLNPRKLVRGLQLERSQSEVDLRAGLLLAARRGPVGAGGGVDLRDVPETLDIRASAAEVDRETLTWAKLRGAIGPDLTAKVYRLAVRYGYENSTHRNEKGLGGNRQRANHRQLSEAPEDARRVKRAALRGLF